MMARLLLAATVLFLSVLKQAECAETVAKVASCLFTHIGHPCRCGDLMSGDYPATAT
jgi:hypothetical protein